MDNKMKEVLGQYLESMLELIKAGGDVAAEQIPLVVQEKLTFDLWMSIVYAVAAAVPIILGIAMVVKAIRVSRVEDPFGYAIAAIASLIIGVPLLLVNVHTVLKIWLAPRIYIIDWLMQMVASK